MSNDNPNHGSNNSFSHAFLPGLILGLIVGAVAGAFLPDLMGGPRLPDQTMTGQPDGESRRGERVRQDEQPGVEEPLNELREEMEDNPPEHDVHDQSNEDDGQMKKPDDPASSSGSPPTAEG